MKFQFFNSPARMPDFISAWGTVATNPSPVQRYLVLALAIGLTILGEFIAACAGWESGGSLRDRLVIAAMGFLIVASSSVLPALARHYGGMLRVVILAAWIGCVSYALLGQATFFALARQDAGDARAMAVNVPDTPERVASRGRSLTVIAQDEAAVTAKLESTKAAHCPTGACRWRDARQHALEAQLTALEVEADQAKRREAREDRAARLADDARALRESRRADPVGLQAEALFGWRAASIGLFRTGLPAVMLELLPALFWMMAFASERRVAPRPTRTCSKPAAAPSVAADALASETSGAAGTGAEPRRVMPLDKDLAAALRMVTRVWKAGRTVALVIGRRYAAWSGVGNK